MFRRTVRNDRRLALIPRIQLPQEATLLQRSELTGLSFLLGAWLVLLLIIGYAGNFAQNDDWAYALTTRTLVETGSLKLDNWVATNLLTNVLWGAAFAWLLGFSYESLRISTLVAAYLCLGLTYLIATSLGARRSTAAIAALSTMAFPLFLLHAYGFMSDVPYMIAQTASVFFLIAALKRDSKLMAALGWLLAAAALLSRQTGFAIPIAFAVAAILSGPRTPRHIGLAILPAIAFFVIQFAYQRWLTATGGISGSFGSQLYDAQNRLTNPEWLLTKLAFVAKNLTLYLGLCLLPLSLWVSCDSLSVLGRRLAWAAVILVLAVGFGWGWILIEANDLMPTWWNTWGGRGFGIGADGIEIPRWVRVTLTFFSTIGGTLLVVLVGQRTVSLFLHAKMDTFQRRAGFFGLFGFLAMVASIFIADPVWDRYVLPLIPWLVILIVARDSPSAPRTPVLPRHASRIAAGVVLAAMGAYSTMELYNHMEERRAIGALTEELVARGVDREIINAGWVFDSPTTKRIGDWDNRFNQDVRYFIRQVGYNPDGYRLLETRDVPRILLPGMADPDEAIFIRLDTAPP